MRLNPIDTAACKNHIERLCFPDELGRSVSVVVCGRIPGHISEVTEENTPVWLARIDMVKGRGVKASKIRTFCSR